MRKEPRICPGEVTGLGCTGTEHGLCGHAGHRDWRIPNVKELQSIVDYGQVSPAIDPTFPGPTAAAFYWSATTVVDEPSSAWLVDFGLSGGVGGHLDAGNKVDESGGTRVGRAVRGGS